MKPHRIFSLIVSIVFVSVLAACGGLEEDPRCTQIKAKMESCSGELVAMEATCSPALLENADQVLAADCSSLQDPEGKADWSWLWGGCDPGFHRCNGVFCCQDFGYVPPEQRILGMIQAHQGTPWAWGGCSWAYGMDCSCFVQTVLRDAVGVNLPRTVEEQWNVGKSVWQMNLRPGDLVFFNFSWASWFQKPTHVGIYVGVYNGMESFAHASKSNGVSFAPVNSEYWSSNYKGARRVLEQPGWW